MFWKIGIVSLILGSTTLAAHAEMPAGDPSFPTQAPLYVVGSKVQWVDGSPGEVIDRAEWVVENGVGEYYYLVWIVPPEGMVWRMAESGLSPIEDAVAPIQEEMSFDAVHEAEDLSFMPADYVEDAYFSDVSDAVPDTGYGFEYDTGYDPLIDEGYVEEPLYTS